MEDINVEKAILIIIGWLIEETKKLNNSSQKDMSKIEKNMSLLRELREALNLAETNKDFREICQKILDYFPVEEKESKNDDIPSIIMKRAERFIVPVTRAEQDILFNTDKNIDFYAGGADVKIAPRGKETITTFIALNFEDIDPETVKISRIERLDEYTRAIYNATISLYNAGNTLIPLNSIYQVSTGYRKTNKTPEEKTRQDIEDALRIARFTRVKIDATQEGQKLYPELESFTRESYLLPAEYKKAKINGQVVDCIEILKEPPLYEYARLKKQISSLDITLLDVPLNFTRDNVILKEYLIRQISIMKNSKSNRNEIILYETLYKLLKVENKIERKRIRDKVHTILDYWVSKEFIKGYEEISQGKNIAKIKIILDNPKKEISARIKRK